MGHREGRFSLTSFGGSVSLDARRAAAAFALAGIALVVLLVPRPAADQMSPPAAQPKLPLSFVPNVGQVDARVRYYAQTPGFDVYFTRSGVTMALSKGERGHAVELRFVGASRRAQIEGTSLLPGKFNDFTGKERHTSMPTYAGIVYRDLWPGIDLSFARERGRLKYQLHLAPGANLADAQFSYRGADSVSKAAGGTLAVHTPLGVIKDAAPVSYQQSGGKRVPVETHYALVPGSGRFRIEAPGGYDPGRPLVVDPSLVYATFLGGDFYDFGKGIAVDGEGSAYVAGSTSSSDFPTTPGAFDRDPQFKAFIAKLTPDGSDLVYSTALGGSGGSSEAASIAVDEQGSAYVTGRAGSGFPTTPGAYNRTGGFFVTKLNETGSQLVYSTRVGGGEPAAIAIDGEGNAYVTGITLSFSYPTTPGAYDTSTGGLSAFVTKVNADGSALDYSTFLGNSGENSYDVAVDSAGSAYVAAVSNSADYPTTPGAYDATFNGSYDAVLTKLNPQGSGLVYSTYLGGTGLDGGRAVEVDAEGQAYVSGETGSPDFPVTSGAYDTTYNGTDGLDVYVTKLSASGANLVYSTFLGGPGVDSPFSLDIDPGGDAYLTGAAENGFPTVPHESDPPNGFTAKLTSDGSRLAYSTGRISGVGIAADSKGNTYLTGSAGPSFQTTPGAYDTTYNDDGRWSDAFAAKLGAGPPATLTLAPKTATNTLDAGGHCVTATVRDAATEPTPSITVTFTVTGAVSSSGTQTTDSNGEARFCYQGPELPGTDQITASVEPSGPSDTATKTWVVPATTDGCRVTGEGRITAQNGDLATFETNVWGESTTTAKGHVRHTDRGPAEPLRLNSKAIDSLVCEGRRATIFAQEGSIRFRVELNDRGKRSRLDTYRIVLSSGYDSGTQTLQRGDIMVLG